MATITGTDASDFLVGTDDGDLVNGGLGNDTIRGLGGNDTLNGAEGNDDLDGGDGNDYLIGGAGNDTLQGGMNADTLEGGDGNDVLRGGKGFDSIDGGDGNDTIYSGLGQDTLTGGAGADVFVLRGDDPNFPGALKAPTITDFVAGTDTIAIQGATADEITTALTAQTTVDGGVSFEINGATVVVKGTGLTSLTASNVTTEDGIPENNPGQSFTLTTGTDTPAATSGNDTITAGALAPDGTTAATTLNALDVIDGGAGTDTLILDTTGNQNQSVLGTITNVENLTFVGTGAAIADVAAATFSGTIKYQQTADTAVAVTGVTGQTIAIDRVADATTVTAGYAATQASATLTAAAPVGDATFSISGTGLKTANLTVDKTATGKSVTVADTGNTTTAVNITASGASTVVANSTALATVSVGGAGLVSLTLGTAAATSVDASASTGGLNLATAMATGATFTGGAGKDTVTIGASTVASTMGAGDDTVNLSVAALGSGGSVDGGDGSDTISLSAANAATASATTTFAASISNFEKFGVGLAGAATTINADNIDGITHIVSAGTSNTFTLTVNNLAANSTFEQTAALGTTAGATLNLKDATGTSDVLNLKFSATDGFTNGTAITAAGVETLNIVTDDTDTTAPTTVFTIPITATSVKSVTVSGDVGIDLTGLTATTLTSLDASGVTATGAAGAVTITTGALAAAATLTGGAGNDTINASAATKAVTLTGGAGGDTLTGSSTVASTINGGDGNDILTGGAGADTINGGAGNDQITSGAGLDIVDVGTGTDTFIVTANSNGNIYATISGMGSGDKVDFLAGGAAATFTTAAITLASTAAFADFLQASAAGGADRVVWFQFGGDTYLVQDVTAGATFTNGADQVVKLSGLIDLSTATIDGAGTNVLTLG
ncbi:beta strand repeat-containing protein [Oceanibaculum nanhaiense]|uniref:beta strand repeat-containing protein n=1 Tax=Oceanibaculum nanhaiense TaxID=1909734 RepID=UPI000A3CCFB3|nr:hypothetical protein [Oceanibaculum nanhaiense]